MQKTKGKGYQDQGRAYVSMHQGKFLFFEKKKTMNFKLKIRIHDDKMIKLS
jgi:hypothetical protein